MPVAAISRAHPDAARGYERLKRDLAAKHPNNCRAYTDAKAAFIEGIIAAVLGYNCTSSHRHNQ